MVLIMLSTPVRTTLVYHGAKIPLTGGVIIQDIRLANLKLLIHEAGDNASELSRRLDNVPPSYISQIITGVPTPKGTRRGVGDGLARKLERGMKKPRGWMDQPHPELTMHAKASPASVSAGPDLPRRVYPEISWIQAGNWTEIVDNFAPGEADNWYPCPVKCGPNTFILRVEGDSMQPRFASGELIFVDPDAEALNKSFVVVRLDDEARATFKQLVIEGQRSYLKPLNDRWPDPVIEVNGNATICGVVVFQGRPV